MASIIVTKEVAAPAGKVWALLANFADVSWIPVAGDVVVEGSGPGMRRRIQSGGGAPIVERLVSMDPGERTLRYSIDENNPIPVRRYEATLRVTPAIDGKTTIQWDVSFEPIGDEAETATGIGVIYDMMATWLETAAKEAP